MTGRTAANRPLRKPGVGAGVRLHCSLNRRRRLSRKDVRGNLG
jgi:hypothetical protein